jgi:xanthine/CO dehydrogenase XdhC/CoxF family maturation factor
VEEGIASKDQIQRVACPVGLSINAVSVHEIAVSILAQFIEKRATHLRVGSTARLELAAS